MMVSISISAFTILNAEMYNVGEVIRHCKTNLKSYNKYTVHTSNNCFPVQALAESPLDLLRNIERDSARKVQCT